MSDTKQNQGTQPGKLPSRYDVITEAFAKAPQYIYQDVSRVLSIVRGTAERTGSKCQIRNCSHGSIGWFPHPEQYQENIDVCRKHWVMLHGAIAFTRVLLLLLVLLAPLFFMEIIQP